MIVRLLSCTPYVYTFFLPCTMNFQTTNRLYRRSHVFSLKGSGPLSTRSAPEGPSSPPRPTPTSQSLPSDPWGSSTYTPDTGGPTKQDTRLHSNTESCTGYDKGLGDRDFCPDTSTCRLWFLSGPPSFLSSLWVSGPTTSREKV